MKGGRSGRTDWSRLEAAPDPRHYADFARLAGAIARRYPDIRHFLVWNELKGFYDEDKCRWNYEGYTELYNLVHAELKKRNPDNLVGGPYVVVDHDPPADDEEDRSRELRGAWGELDQRSADVIRYWNAHKAGADFVVVDGSSYTREGHRTIPDEFAATEKFADVTRWVRRTTGLPVWWAEWYVEPPAEDDRPGGRDGWSEQHRTAVHAAAMMRLAASGASAAFYWNPQQTGDDCPGCLWRSTHLRDGGGELPMARLLSRFAREFPPGTAFRPVVATAGTGNRIQVLGDDAAVLVVNTECSAGRGQGGRAGAVPRSVRGALADLLKSAVLLVTGSGRPCPQPVRDEVEEALGALVCVVVGADVPQSGDGEQEVVGGDPGADGARLLVGRQEEFDGCCDRCVAPARRCGGRTGGLAHRIGQSRLGRCVLGEAVQPLPQGLFGWPGFEQLAGGLEKPVAPRSGRPRG
ncbi:hypothetical protein GCM10020000_04400 [Streptomyces olivoverticillatus]